MTVRTDDCICAALEQLFCDGFLRFGRLQRRFAAPVEHDEDDIRLERLRRVYRAQKGAHVELVVVGAVILVEQVHRVLRALWQLEAAEALRIGNDRNLHTADSLKHDAAVLRAFGLARIGAGMVDARVCERVNGALQPGQAVLNRTGIGCLQKIEANGRKRRSK